MKRWSRVKRGMSPDVLFRSLSKGSANSFVLQNHVKNHVLTGHFSEGMFSVDYEMKDLGLALLTADNLQVSQHFGSLAYQTYSNEGQGLKRAVLPSGDQGRGLLLCAGLLIARPTEASSYSAGTPHTTLQHASYPGILATVGNLAYPMSPFTIPCGPVYVFHMDHLLAVADPCECFDMQVEEVGRAMATVLS